MSHGTSVYKPHLETTKIDIHLLWPSFCFEVLKTATMLFYTLSGIETNRPRNRGATPNMGYFLPLPELPAYVSPLVLLGKAKTACTGQLVQLHALYTVDGFWKYMPSGKASTVQR